MPKFKKLIICCDGTWQASDKPGEKNVESNVTRMCRALSEASVKKRKEKSHETQQVVYYQSGVGTDVFSRFDATMSGASGEGLNENVVEAYNFLCLNYDGEMIYDEVTKEYVLDEKPSDKIFLFGFSRGAYTVRALSAVIDTFGILTKTCMKYFHTVYELYQSNDLHGKGMAAYAKYEAGMLTPEDFKKMMAQDTFTEKAYKFLEKKPIEFKVGPQQVKIKVIGVWDTVGSLGVPEAWFTIKGIREWMNHKYEFHNPRISDRVENAFHALALDEHRRPFSPTLWHLKPSEQQEEKRTHMIQCWFPGVHINTGGGNSDEEDEKERRFTDLGQISYITFAWMVDLCKNHLSFDDEYLDAMAKEHREKIKELKETMKNNKIHTGGWAQGMINDSFDSSMAAAGSRTRSPGQYDEKNQFTAQPALEESITNEYVHPSARVRISKRFSRVGNKVWDRPTDQQSLAGFQLQYRADQTDPHCSGLVWVKEDVENKVCIELPEYKIPGLLEEKAEDCPHRAESKILDENLCSEEREMVMNPSKHVVKLPPPPPESLAGKALSSSYKLVLGYLPSSMHFWENEQSSTLSV